MSGVLIKGMKMPSGCMDCKLLTGGEGCAILGSGWYEEREGWRRDDCPLVPVPDHGRLIDADALCEGLVSNHPVVIHAKCAPTIIPAEEEVEE